MEKVEKFTLWSYIYFTELKTETLFHFLTLSGWNFSFGIAESKKNLSSTKTQASQR